MILSPAELPDDPHALAVGLFERVRAPGRRVGSGCPVTPPGSAPRRPTSSWARPSLGEHTDELLTELGLDDRIAELRRDGVVA